METKSNNVKEVTMYRASIKFEGKWFTTPATATFEEQFDFVKRAREKSTSKNLPVNFFTETSYVPAE